MNIGLWFKIRAIIRLTALQMLPHYWEACNVFGRLGVLTALQM